MKVDFFISRAGPDAEWAQWIAQILKEAGYSFVLQDWDFRPGEDFVANMDRAMRSSERTIAVLSRNYDTALFTVPEWTHAVAKDPTGLKASLVPVRVDDIVPEGIFKTRVFIDLVGADPQEARRRLLDGLRRGRQKTSPVEFPGTKVTARFPGALPPIWRTPSERNPVFVGREHEFEQVRACFLAGDPPPQVVALIGLGGVGKTAIAVEYAHRERDAYKVVWWVRGERRETVAADLALLAERLELARASDDVGVRVDAARRWLVNHDRWLIIVDDAADAAVARDAIPAGGGGHVLLTSRAPSWRRIATVVDVPPLLDDTGAELVAKRSGHRGDARLTQLSHLLGGLPVALELAGAFLEQQGIEIAEYLQRLRRRGGLPFDDPEFRPPDYAMSLDAVWRESFATVAAESAAASDLLHLAAYLAPDDVPRSALTLGASRLPSGLSAVAKDVDLLADLVARPRALSLITSAGDGFSMHRLVQSTLRQSLAQADRRRWAADAINWVEYVLPTQVQEHRLWSRTGRLIGHAMTAAEHGCELGVERSRTVVLLDRGATYLATSGGLPADIDSARTAAMKQAEQLPDGPPSWLLNNQALWLQSRDQLGEAEKLLRHAVEAARKYEGGNSPGLGVHYANLGALLKDQGKLDEARRMLLKAVTILDRQPASFKGATAHSHLGQVMVELGDRPAAAGHFASAVRAYDTTLGPGSLDAITARSFLAQARGEDPNLAIVSYEVSAASVAAEEGRLLAAEPAWAAEAEQLLRKAVEQKQPGAAVELASLLREQDGHAAEADAIIEQAAAGGDAEALYCWARELAERGNGAAEACIRRSIAAGNVFSQYDLGLLLASNPARRAEAEAAFRVAIEAGYDIALNDLGILLCDWTGRESEGETLLATAGRRGQARSWANLAHHFGQTNRPLDEIDALRAAADGGYLRAWGTLAYRLEHLGRLEDAMAAFSEGLAAGERGLHPHVTEFLKRHPELAHRNRQATNSVSSTTA